MRNKKVIFWTTGIDDLILEKGLVGGLTLQLSLWANTFNRNGWNCISFTNNKELSRTSLNSLYFIHFPQSKYLNILLEFFFTFYILVSQKPQIVISRGASRRMFALSILTKLVRANLIFMTASDSDLIPGEELISRPWDRSLYRRGLVNCENFIVQNEEQLQLLTRKIKKVNVITIPNVWETDVENSSCTREYILWVSNFRELKRPDWFLEVARNLPDRKFIMVGGAMDQVVYNRCLKKSMSLQNLEFRGALNLSEVNNLFKRSYLFVCTSEIEGFPNTFLQAWANNIPVISAFDPSDVIQKKNLGIKVCTIEELIVGIKTLDDPSLYNSMQKSIQNYFETSHQAEIKYSFLKEKFSFIR